jgi:hypothetical protein
VFLGLGVGDRTEVLRALDACIADRTPVLDLFALGGGLLPEFDDREAQRLVDRIVNPPQAAIARAG